MTDFPDIKVKALVSFPAAVHGGTGLSITQDGGVFTFDLDYSELAVIAAIPAPAVATTFLVLWESSQDTYRRISLTDFKAALAALP